MPTISAQSDGSLSATVAPAALGGRGLARERVNLYPFPVPCMPVLRRAGAHFHQKAKR